MISHKDETCNAELGWEKKCLPCCPISCITKDLMTPRNRVYFLCVWRTTYYWCRPIDAGHIDADHIDAGHYSCPWSTFDASHVWCPSLLRPRKHFWCQSLLMPVTFDVSHHWCPLLLMPLVTIDASHYWCPFFRIEILPVSPNLT